MVFDFALLFLKVEKRPRKCRDCAAEFDDGFREISRECVFDLVFVEKFVEYAHTLNELYNLLVGYNK